MIHLSKVVLKPKGQCDLRNINPSSKLSLGIHLSEYSILIWNNNYNFVGIVIIIYILKSDIYYVTQVELKI